MGEVAQELAGVLESSGVELHEMNGALIGDCPLCADTNDSLSIDTQSQTWKCSACERSGSAVEWVMAFSKVSRKHAGELIRSGFAPPATKAKAATSRTLPSPIDEDASDEDALDQVLTYYSTALDDSPEATELLDSFGISGELAKQYRLGYSNRTLGLRIANKPTVSGGKIRRQLCSVGIYRPSGHENFAGSIVVPCRDADGRIAQIYGYRFCKGLKERTRRELWLPNDSTGIFIAGALDPGGEPILVPTPLVALVLHASGTNCAMSPFGNEVTPEVIVEQLATMGIARIVVATPLDMCAKVATRLAAKGIEVAAAPVKTSMDADVYFQAIAKARVLPAHVVSVARTENGLGDMARSSMRSGDVADLPPANTSDVGQEQVASRQSPMTSGGPSKVPRGEVRGEESDHDASEPNTPGHDTAEHDTPGRDTPVRDTPERDRPEHDRPEWNTPGRDTPGQALWAQVSVEVIDEDVHVDVGDRHWRIRGLPTATSPSALKVNLLIRRGTRFHVDTLDLYSARQRTGYTGAASREIRVSPEVIKADISKLLMVAESCAADFIDKALKSSEAQSPVMSEEEKRRAMDYLCDPDLVSNIVADFGALGLVGEETNALVCYLATISRKLDNPLGVVIQSTSASGKSALMEAALRLVPPEDARSYSAITGQSLYYLSGENLSHKVLCIAEEEGAARASYALKLLASQGYLSIASTGKDPATGRLETQPYEVKGPVALLMTTTAIDIDEELANRCLVVTVDEEPTQTAAIHEAQRASQTLEGIVHKAGRDALIVLHRNVQRLIAPIAVANPYAGRLTFSTTSIRSRRDHARYLALISTVALLHQYQRETKYTTSDTGQSLAYIEVEPIDIEIANGLIGELVGRSLDDLPPVTRSLLTKLAKWVQGRSEVTFTRREAREGLRIGDTQLKIHLARLVEMELLVSYRKCGVVLYELAWAGEGNNGTKFLPGLWCPPTSGADGYAANRAGPKVQSAGGNRGQDGGQTGSDRDPVNPVKYQKGGPVGSCLGAETQKNAIGGPVPVSSHSSSASHSTSAVAS